MKAKVQIEKIEEKNFKFVFSSKEDKNTIFER